MVKTNNFVGGANVFSTVLNRTQAGTLRGVTGYISEFARLVNTKAADKRDVKQANERLAKTAQKASLARYDERRAQSSVGQYRMGANRVSGGRLRAAIASSDFVSSDVNGFGVGNVAKLNKEAIHWARINYSAGPQAGYVPQIPVRFDERIVATLYSNRKAAPLWSIPPGAYFNEAGEMHISRFAKGRKRKIKAAHEPYHFIEEGFRAAAKQVGPEYETMMFDWLSKSGQDAKNFTTKGGVNIRLRGVTLK